MEVVRDTTDDGKDNPVLVPLIDSVFCMTAAFDVVRDTADRRFSAAVVARFNLAFWGDR